MAAIITDQVRILNAKNFVAGIANASNSYYSFVGLPNPTDYLSTWNDSPPAPKDNFDQENDYWNTMIAMKRINSTDVRQVVPRRNWSSGTTYDMYRHDYSRSNTAPVSGSTNLYNSNFYVLNSDYRVYICLQNGTNPENTLGRPSLDEPTFTDLEPKAAGTSGDGYIWKYLYTIKPADITKFDSTDFMPVPTDWSTSNDTSLVRENAVDGSIKIVTITNRGADLGTANQPILEFLFVVMVQEHNVLLLLMEIQKLTKFLYLLKDLDILLELLILNPLEFQQEQLDQHLM